VSSPIHDTNGNLVSDKKEKLIRWSEYYLQLLNRPPSSQPSELEEEATAAVPDPFIDCGEPTVEEVAAAIHRMKNGKAAGICNIPVELHKFGGPACVEWLTWIYEQVWQTGYYSRTGKGHYTPIS